MSRPAAAAPWRSALYEGCVSHRRLERPTHAFRYRVLLTLLDLDELGTLDRSLRLFGHARARALSFRDQATCADRTRACARSSRRSFARRAWRCRAAASSC